MPQQNQRFRFLRSTFVPLATLAPLVVNPARAQTNAAPTLPPMTLLCSFVKGPPGRLPYPVELFVDLGKHSVKKAFPGTTDSDLYVEGQTFTKNGLVKLGMVRWEDSSKLTFGEIVKAHPDFVGEKDVLDFDTGVLEDDAGDVHQCHKAESLR